MEKVIKIKDIRRDFQLGQEVVKVLKGIDLEIEKGEYVAFMGPSGSGKSTLMNLLGCLDTPTSGSYILNGKDVSQMSDDELAEISMGVTIREDSLEAFETIMDQQKSL